jgi:uncharacterized RDD family membrane protein YckC
VTPSEREPLLFDLPPVGEPPAGGRASKPRRRLPGAAGHGRLPFPDLPTHATGAVDVGAGGEPAAGLVSDGRSSASAAFSSRLLAGLLDLAIVAATTAVTTLGAHALLPSGATWNWLPVLCFFLVFSLFATVLPLAFWRRTAGMSLAKIEARALDGQALSFRQSFARWLGGLMTILGAGIPLLIALSGRSLADRVSGSQTLRR